MRVDIASLDDNKTPSFYLSSIYFSGESCGDFSSIDEGNPCLYLFQDVLKDFRCGLFGARLLSPDGKDVLRCGRCIDVTERWKW